MADLNLSSKTDPDLLRAIRAAAEQTMTPTEVWDQRISWCMGMLPSDSTLTRPEVERISTLMYGPRPLPPLERERALAKQLKWALGYAEYALSSKSKQAFAFEHQRFEKAKALASSVLSPARAKDAGGRDGGGDG